MGLTQDQVESALTAAQQYGGQAVDALGEESQAGKLVAGALGAAATGAAVGGAVGGPAAPISAAVGAVIGAASVLLPAALSARKKRRAAVVDKKEVRQLWDEHVLGLGSHPGSLTYELGRQAAAGNPPRLTRAGRREVERLKGADR